MLKELLSGSRSLRTGRGLLLPLLNRYLLTVEEHRRKLPWMVMDMQGDWRDREAGWFHPSNLSNDFCERRWVIGTYELGETDDDVDERPSADQSRIFAMGSLLHAQVQYWLADMGVLYGRWRCTAPEPHTWWDKPEPRDTKGRCISPNCHYPVVYREVPLEIPSLSLRGHMDGEIVLDEECVGLEVKSCNARFFDSVAKEPYAKHLEQAIWYLFGRTLPEGRPMLALKEPKLFPHLKLPLKRVAIIYINKDTSKCREHVIELTPELRRAIIEPRLKQMKLAKQYVRGALHTLPARTCENQAEGRMRRCPMIDACFTLPPVPARRPLKRKKVRA